MSLDTWKKEFYPIPARDAEKGFCMYHSYRKWLGTLPENLQKHGLHIEKNFRIVEDADSRVYIFFGNETCALCLKYQSNTFGCTSCPLFNPVTRENCCDTTTSPYQIFGRTGDPTPMLNLLLKADWSY